MTCLGIQSKNDGNSNVKSKKWRKHVAISNSLFALFKKNQLCRELRQNAMLTLVTHSRQSRRLQWTEESLALIFLIKPLSSC